MTRAVMKWVVPVDGQDHEIGTGRVVLAAVQEANRSDVTLWTDEPNSFQGMARKVRVFGTGHPVPADWEHLGSVVMEPFVWHVFGEPVVRPKASHRVELASQPLEFEPVEHDYHGLGGMPVALDKGQLRGHR